MNISADPSVSRGPDAVWTLAAQCDQEALLQLQTFLSTHRDSAVCLEAGELKRPDTILLQILLSARRDWAARGVPFRTINLPDRLLSLLPHLGLEPDTLGIEAHR